MDGPFLVIPCSACGMRWHTDDQARRCCLCIDCGAPTDRAATGNILRSQRHCAEHARLRVDEEIAEHERYIARLAARGLKPCPEFLCVRDDHFCGGTGTVAL